MIRLSVEDGQTIITILKAYGGHSAQSIQERVEAQIAHPRHPQDLIETITAIVQKPAGKSVIPSAIMTSLRAALLSPSELARIAALSNSWQTCGECKRTISNGEMITITQQSIYCLNCVVPSYSACPDCSATAELTGSNVKALAKMRANMPCVCKADGNRVVTGNDRRAARATRPAAEVRMNEGAASAGGDWVGVGNVAPRLDNPTTWRVLNDAMNRTTVTRTPPAESIWTTIEPPTLNDIFEPVPFNGEPISFDVEAPSTPEPFDE